MMRLFTCAPIAVRKTPPAIDSLLGIGGAGGGSTPDLKKDDAPRRRRPTTRRRFPMDGRGRRGRAKRRTSRRPRRVGQLLCGLPQLCERAFLDLPDALGAD